MRALTATLGERAGSLAPMSHPLSSPVVIRDFARITDPAVYAPVPGDHLLMLADIVRSTAAVTAGRYRSVNMAGAAFICSAMNALGRRDLDFSFGGDGAFYVARPGEADIATRAASLTAAWAARAYGLDMRVASVPIADIRGSGRDVAIARFGGQGGLDFAMFSGGGALWAEDEMKAGRFRIAPANDDADPELTGLSCRWQPFPSRHGTILSLIAVPRGGADAGFWSTIAEVIALIDAELEASGRPLPEHWPYYRPSFGSLALEARAATDLAGRLRRWASALVRTTLARGVFATGLAVPGFDPATYWPIAVANSDYRKYADGLRMTVDCTPAAADRIERHLADASARGILMYGLHHQQAAQMTCIVPSTSGRDHVHFIDGAGGGYAAAMASLRARSQ